MNMHNLTINILTRTHTHTAPSSQCCHSSKSHVYSKLVHLERSCGMVGRGAFIRSLSSFLSGLKTIGSIIGGRRCAGTYLNGPVTLGGTGSALTEGGGPLPGGVFSLEDEVSSCGLGAVGGSLGTFLSGESQCTTYIGPNYIQCT